MHFCGCFCPISMDRFLALLAVVVFIVLQPGCKQTDNDEQKPQLQGTLTVEVAGDSQLAKAIESLSAEWQAQSGFRLQVKEVALDELLAGKTGPSDLVVCPSAALGPLAEQGRLWPLPGEFTSHEYPGWNRIFSLLQVRELRWQQQAYAVPLGSPVFVLYYRADVFEKMALEPPTTWREYLALVEKLRSRSALQQAGVKVPADWLPTVEPLAPGWAGLVLLAHAAPYMAHRDSLSKLFDAETMEPLINTPPYVRALEEIVQVASFEPSAFLNCDLDEARRRFWQGRCAMAVCWPCNKAEIDTAAEGVTVAFAELPGSVDVYNRGLSRWEKRRADEDPHVPLLAVAGRVAAVDAASQHRDAALQLAFWLSVQQARHVSPASLFTAPYRSEHLQQVGDWTEKPVPAGAAVQYGQVLSASLNRMSAVMALRIPGRDEYLAALDEAVSQAVAGKLSPKQALEQAGERWRKITESLGLDAQRAAYRHEIGLD